MRILKPLVVSSLFLSIVSFAQDSKDLKDTKPQLRLDGISAQDDTSIVIKKGPQATVDLRPDFEIIAGDGEIFGDPEMGQKASFASWKVACENWKKELKELNKGNHILVINCNSPTSTQSNGLMTFQSRGTYKIKVPMRAGKANPSKTGE